MCFCLAQKISFFYLHRGTKKLAFRWPNKKNVLELLKKTGPLASTSANREGEKPAENILEAKRYFGNKVDFYIDAGELKSVSSTLVDIKDGKLVVLREGSFKIENLSE